MGTAPQTKPSNWTLKPNPQKRIPSISLETPFYVYVLNLQEVFMLTSLALIFLLGLSMAAVCQKLKLPRIIGMVVTGIVLGPYALDLLDESILTVSSDLRQMALIIILLKAGLSLDISDLKRVGRQAVMMAFVPAGF